MRVFLITLLVTTACSAVAPINITEQQALDLRQKCEELTQANQLARAKVCYNFLAKNGYQIYSWHGFGMIALIESQSHNAYTYLKQSYQAGNQNSLPLLAIAAEQIFNIDEAEKFHLLALQENPSSALINYNIASFYLRFGNSYSVKQTAKRYLQQAELLNKDAQLSPYFEFLLGSEGLFN